jgi:crotonobetainyl-CoA:carnitine CoA-transferase CaiB-like acyl-CoA transferase
MTPDPAPASSHSFLAGLRVLDLSIWRPGPYATSLLAGLGADVLKVEPPGGDPMRHYPDLFGAVNAGKRSIALDLKDPAALERALDLAAEADVVVEGFRPGVMEGLGLDEPVVRRTNPGVVYCSISGYGQHGALARLPGHDVNYQAWAGALAPEGGPAGMPPLPVADLASGLTAAFGICAALLGRGVSGQGAYLDISMTDVMATWTGDATAAAGPTVDSAPSSDLPPDHSVPGYGIFTTGDGTQIALGVVNEQHFWSALCGELGLGTLSHLTFEERLEQARAVGSAVAAAIATRARDELVPALVGAGVPVAPVLDRAHMAAAPDPGPFTTFPTFPIRMPSAIATGEVPALDAHHGESFLPRPRPQWTQ